MHLAQQVACRSGALVILVVGTMGVLIGSHHAGRAHQSHSSPLAAQHQLIAQVATHASPVDAPAPATSTATGTTIGSAPGTASTVGSSATISSSPAAAVVQAKVASVPQVAGVAAAPAAVANVSPNVGPNVSPNVSKGPVKDTIASWYNGRPVECWNGGEPMALPVGLKMWAASRTLACGTTIEVDGPAGTAILLIEDHGPYLHPGRDLDLSPLAFRKVAGPLAKGVVRVEYRVAPGASPSP